MLPDFFIPAILNIVVLGIVMLSIIGVFIALRWRQSVANGKAESSENGGYGEGDSF